MHLDTRTLVLITLLVTLAVSPTMLVASRRFPSYVGRAVRDWGIGLGIMGVSYLLFVLRGAIPDFFAVVVSDSLMILAVGLHYRAIYTLKQEPGSMAWPGILVLLNTILFSYFLYVTDNVRARTIIFGFLAATVMLFKVKRLIFDVPNDKRFLYWLSAAFVIWIVVSFLARSVILLVDPQILAVTTATTTLQTAVFVSAFIGTAIISLLFLLMAADEFTAQISDLAARDALTNVYNRRAFDHLAQRALLATSSRGQSLSLLAIDLDHFKAINDRYGHAGGDIVLKQVVEAISSCLRERDIFGRYGGEEFFVLLPYSAPVDAMGVAQRLHRAVQDLRVPVQDNVVSITVSIGVATLGQHGYDLNELKEASDSALYQAKANGRNQTVLAH